jgi:DNA-binding MarR family transcriptional regulator
MPHAAAKTAATKAKAAPRASAKTAATKVMPAWEPAAPGLWYCNWKIFLEARRRLDRALAPLELRAREFWLLAIAGAGNVPQHEIADRCGLDPSSLVAILDGLERRGWLRRQHNPRDRRVHWVQRTEAGDHLFARALPRAQRAEAGQLAALSVAQQRQLVGAMRKLVTNSK